jgi:hypothetical protein
VIVFFPIYPRPISAFSRKKENVFIYIQRRSSFKKSFASFCPVLVGWHGRKAEEEKRGENSSGLWFATKKKIPHGRKNKGMPKGFFFKKSPSPDLKIMLVILIFLPVQRCPRQLNVV